MHGHCTMYSNFTSYEVSYSKYFKNVVKLMSSYGAKLRKEEIWLNFLSVEMDQFKSVYNEYWPYVNGIMTDVKTIKLK